MRSNQFDLVVVGAGIAGLVAAAVAAQRGRRVAVASSGPGSFVFGAGTVEARSLDAATPGLDEAFAFFHQFSGEAGVPFLGGCGVTHLIPTMLGSFQVASMAPFTLWNADPHEATDVAVVGVRGMTSINAKFIAERLNTAVAALSCRAQYRAVEIELPPTVGTFPSALQFANRYDQDATFREQLRAQLTPLAHQAEALIVPGVLGLQCGRTEFAQLECELGAQLCELPTLPPSVPGLRLYHHWEARLQRLGVEMYTGFPIARLECDSGRCVAVWLETPARPLRLEAATVILATGPFSWLLLGNEVVGYNRQMQPVDAQGAPLVDNVYVAGTMLRGAGDVRGLQGGNALAILTGYVSGAYAAGEARFWPLPESLGAAGVQYA